MKLVEFEKLITELPYLRHSFEISKRNWNLSDQSVLINHVFADIKTITLSRKDLFESNQNIPIFIIKTLMWGYPSGGRGDNIKVLLKANNFECLVDILEGYHKDQNIEHKRLVEDTAKIQGLGISTISKLIHFLKIKVNGHNTVILDAQIINTIRSGRYEDFHQIKRLKTINVSNALSKYRDYLIVINYIAQDLNVLPDQIELFLFLLGKNLI